MHSPPSKTRFGRLESAVAAFCTALILAASPSASAAATETVLHSFAGGPGDGAQPEAGLIFDGAGNLYGTTEYGGASGYGVAFKLAPDGTETVLHAFAGGPGDGAYPFAGLIADSAGNLYGTTSKGGASGYGVAFKLAPDGTETVLHAFTGPGDGAYPFAGLIADSAGNLYGTTEYGGASGYGVAFKLAPDGTETVLHSFAGGTSDGAVPETVLIADSAGNLYGTTRSGGGSGNGGFGWGEVFKLAPDGTETVLHAFAGGTSDGSLPLAGLIADGAGNLYGTTDEGGTSGVGVAFKLAPDGTETVLYSFTGGSDGAFPFAGLIADSAGNLYGTTGLGGASGKGVVFKLAPNGTSYTYTVLYSFTGGSDGGEPQAGLIADSAGNLYGTTEAGGASGYGVVFKLSGTGFVTTPPSGVLLSAPSANDAYYGMYSSVGTAASFTLASSYYVSTIDVVLRTPASTSFTNFHFSLQSALTNPITIFASQDLTAQLGTVSTEVMNVNKTLPAGTYYLVGIVPGYYGTTVTPGDVDGWMLSTGVYSGTAGTIANGLWVGSNPPVFNNAPGYVAPAFTVNGSTPTLSSIINLPTVPVEWRIAGVGRFTGGSTADLVWQNTSTGQVGIWILQNGTLASTINLPTVPVEWQIAGVGDFTGNGTDDLVWQNTTTGQVGIWLLQNGALSSIVNLPTVPVQWQIAGVGKFSGGSTADLVWQNATTGQVGIWLLQNGALASIVNLPTVPVQWRIAGVGDFTGNGTDDLVWQNTTTGQVGIWLLQNGALASIINLPTVPVQWNIAGVGDFTGGGTADLAWQNGSTGQVGTWILQNGTLASIVNLPVVPVQWRIAGVGDFTGNGTDDLVWQNSSTGQVGIWLLQNGALSNTSIQ